MPKKTGKKDVPAYLSFTQEKAGILWEKVENMGLEGRLAPSISNLPELMKRLYEQVECARNIGRWVLQLTLECVLFRKKRITFYEGTENVFSIALTQDRAVSVKIGNGEPERLGLAPNDEFTLDIKSIGKAKIETTTGATLGKDIKADCILVPRITLTDPRGSRSAYLEVTLLRKFGTTSLSVTSEVLITILPNPDVVQMGLVLSTFTEWEKTQFPKRKVELGTQGVIYILATRLKNGDIAVVLKLVYQPNQVQISINPKGKDLTEMTLNPNELSLFYWRSLGIITPGSVIIRISTRYIEIPLA